jgi:predicted nucleotide-binding protein (sugar kinase/HSP70/actin superfamily)
LEDAELNYVPVISLSAQRFEKIPGFTLSPALLNKSMMALVYGDLLMRVLLKVRPYESIKGSANLLYEKWVDKCKVAVHKGNYIEFKNNIRKIVKDFDQLELQKIKKPLVGLVGEILVKFHPTANNNLIDIIEREGGEAVVPDLIDFFLYCGYNSSFRYEKLSGTLKSKILGLSFIQILEFYRGELKKALQKSNRFEPPHSIQSLAKRASEILSLGNQTGEGWFLTAEMLELIDSGVQNIVCMQPFACLPNHVTGKGMMKILKQKYQSANIVAIDYDPGASEVNQLNRIKLMLSVAFKNLYQTLDQSNISIEKNNSSEKGIS